MKNHLKEISAILLICVFTVLLMTSCGKGETSDKSDTSANTGSEINEDGNESIKNSEISVLEKKYANLNKDELKWEYNSAEKAIIISGKGAMRSYSDIEPEWNQYSEEATKVVIGDEVTSVGYAAFYYFSALTEVRLGASVEFIGNFAFSNCYELWTLNFPSSLKYVGEHAFANAMLHSENGFTLPEGMLYIGKEGFYSAFKENAVSIPSSLSFIGDLAFANSFVSAINVDENNPAYTSVEGVLYDKSITTLIHYPANKTDAVYEIPATVTTVKEEAVEVNNNLEKIVIPASVSLFEEDAVFWNYALKTIEVDEGNNSYKAVDGILFSKDGKKLLCYPLASERTEYTVPAGTERICAHAMSQAKNLVKIHTNEGLQEIGDFGLYYCENLKSLGLPKSLISIKEKAFTFCDSLAEIHYAGTNTEWKNVKIGEDNTPLTDETVKITCAQ